MTNTPKLLLYLFLSLHVSSVRAEPLGATKAYSIASSVKDVSQDSDIKRHHIRGNSAEFAEKQVLVKRNDVIEASYKIGQLRIKVSARALASGAIGDEIKLINLSSRSILYGTIRESGVVVSQSGGIGK